MSRWEGFPSCEHSHLVIVQVAHNDGSETAKMTILLQSALEPGARTTAIGHLRPEEAI